MVGLARQRKGSRRRMRTRLRLQRLQRKRANRRKNWQHQVSRRIANRASTVIVEKLNTRGMTKSARGTLENPGTKVKAKSGLNREILSTGWHGMKGKLGYKCSNLIEVNPAYTSQSCNALNVFRKTDWFSGRFCPDYLMFGVWCPSISLQEVDRGALSR